MTRSNAVCIVGDVKKVKLSDTRPHGMNCTKKIGEKEPVEENDSECMRRINAEVKGSNNEFRI